MEQIRAAFDSISQWWFELHFSDLQKKALAFLSVAILMGSVAVVVHGNSQTPIVPEVVPVTIDEPEIFVDVAGAVNKPGVYSLNGKSRVIDAIKAAGDSAPGADLSTINLARVLNDGEQIYVDLIYTAGSRARAGSKASVPRGPININRATASDLDSLDGIGPVIAKRIIAFRTANGPFTAVEDLLKVSGIGDAKFAQ